MGVDGGVFPPLWRYSASVEANESPCVCVSSSRLRRGQMKEASEMKYGDQVEGERSHAVDSHAVDSHACKKNK